VANHTIKTAGQLRLYARVPCLSSTVSPLSRVPAKPKPRAESRSMHVPFQPFARFPLDETGKGEVSFVCAARISLCSPRNAELKSRYRSLSDVFLESTCL